ncbi:hypothetical protein BC939DRAFT_321214 [Gamsiella multidivaricata]|uniref:uncharacterized protein n=1 Tax=Gamsiella multidivaricata TaxID=101098 RepID=UPI00221F6DD0|nr:uncharacterized protein BC939DRAFT_321214 [Gamsiella multidivaricata]KAI7829768.1 hypothetical protein BC939DRAFT_321214 [Gamsiella multidivaricata]
MLLFTSALCEEVRAASTKVSISLYLSSCLLNAAQPRRILRSLTPPTKAVPLTQAIKERLSPTFGFAPWTRRSTLTPSIVFMFLAIKMTLVMKIALTCSHSHCQAQRLFLLSLGVRTRVRNHICVLQRIPVDLQLAWPCLACNASIHWQKFVTSMRVFAGYSEVA